MRWGTLPFCFKSSPRRPVLGGNSVAIEQTLTVFQQADPSMLPKQILKDIFDKTNP
jgi:hypothetical protein